MPQFADCSQHAKAILAAVAAIDGDIKKMTRKSEVCQRLMDGTRGRSDHSIGLCRSN